MKIGCRALAFHIFKNLRLFYKKNCGRPVGSVSWLAFGSLKVKFPGPALFFTSCVILFF